MNRIKCSKKKKKKNVLEKCLNEYIIIYPYGNPI